MFDQVRPSEPPLPSPQSSYPTLVGFIGIDIFATQFSLPKFHQYVLNRHPPLSEMVGEASMITFQPAPELRPVANGSAWRLDKLGEGIDPEAVQDGGNQFTHGVWHGANVGTKSGSLQIESLDAINFNPMTGNLSPLLNDAPNRFICRGSHGVAKGP